MICVVGPSCAGKTTIADWLVEHQGYVHLEASIYVRARHNAETGDTDINDFVRKTFEVEGKDTFAIQMANDIVQKQYDLDKLVLSGLRSNTAIQHFRGRFGSVNVVGVFANALLRLERNLVRPRPLSPRTYAEFVRKDMQEYAFGIAEMLAVEARPILINEGSLDSLYAEIAGAIGALT